MNRQIGDYDALVTALTGLIRTWRERGNDAMANVPAARDAWIGAAQEIADLLGPEAQGAPVPVRPRPPELLQSAARHLDANNILLAALDLVAAVRYRDPAVEFDMRLWESVADRMLMKAEQMRAAS